MSTTSAAGYHLWDTETHTSKAGLAGPFNVWEGGSLHSGPYATVEAALTGALSLSSTDWSVVSISTCEVIAVPHRL
jgi:hypothetical protein